ncbi:MAG: serine/threonine-protein kinase [Myxococcota bacterium]
MSGSDLAATVQGDTLLSSPAAPKEEDGVLPHRVGRYVVLSRLGAGAMGVVLAAYDEQLDRKVAVKLVQPSLARDAELMERMRREGRALAQVSHPNIVNVYEVGFERSLFLAMEFVDGQTLERWAGPDRSWREVLAVHLQAARGLAAAHDAGLVHRDYKPANVMIGQDGRVRVLDFGLARESDTLPVTRESTRVSLSSSGPKLTSFEAVLGTPRYMSPEQFLGQPATAASDQFSFCVSLYEGLVGESPFGGSTMAEIAMLVTGGEMKPLPPSADVPAGVLRALRRGLDRDPAQRWPSMDALIEAVEPRLRTRQRWWGVALALGVATGIGVLGYLGQQGPAPVCQGADEALARGWDSSVRDRVRAGLLATQVPYAQDTADTVTARLDAYASEWRAAHQDACEDTAVRHQQSESLLDLRMACLDGRLDSLRTFTESLETADATTVEHAVRSVDDLPPLGPCADAEALRAQVPPPEDPAAAEEVAALRKEFTRIGLARSLGHDSEATERLRGLHERVNTVDYAPLKLEYSLAQGRSDSALERFEPAREALQDAYYGAVSLGHEQVAAEASVALVTVVGYGLGEPDRGLEWARLAEAQQDRTGGSRRAMLYDGIALLLVNKGKYDDAESYAERGLEHARAHTGEGRSRLVVEAMITLANIALNRGDLPSAHRAYAQALEESTAVLGADHPHSAEVLGMIATAYLYEGNYGEAQELLERSLGIQQRAYGYMTENEAALYMDLGTTAAMQGDLTRAQDQFVKGLAGLTEVLGPEHPRRVAAAINLASVYLARGDHETAAPLLEQAYAINVARSGEQAPVLIEILHNMALVDNARGDHDQALEKASRTIALRQTLSTREHPDTIMAMAAQVEAHLGLDQLEQARAVAEEGLVLNDALGTEVDPIFRAELELLLAMALDRQGVERPRALTLAQAAREVLATRGDLVGDSVDHADELIERLSAMPR